jgi:carbamoyltransferase
MGLAPYGEPRYVDQIKENLIDIKDDGTFRLDISYFKYHRGFRMTGRKFHKLFGRSPRKGETELTQFHMDLAASIQVVTEEIVLKLARSLRQETGIKNLCLAGGVALNCVANGKLLQEKIFDDIWIQPASGDAGSALGAALVGWHQHEEQERVVNTNDSMKGTYLGPEFSNDEIINYLEQINAPFHTHGDNELFERLAVELEKGHVIGWFNGPMEFGPRALGGRSIIGDPRNQKMQSVMNLKIKYRESFRPFAPSVLEEDVSNQFEMHGKSPYMLLVAPVKKELCKQMTEEEDKLFGIEKLNIPRSSLPAITHVDYSARVQTVSATTNPRYYNLISAFKRKTGCPTIVNTSFNVRGEPIVCTPQDAYRCFMRTEMDVLVLQNQILFKDEQPKAEKDETWMQEFELD